MGSDDEETLEVHETKDPLKTLVKDHNDNSDLVHAVEVKGDIEDSKIPSAIAYDQEASQPMNRNRIVRFLIVFLSTLAIVGLTVVGVVVSNSRPSEQVDEKDTDSPIASGQNIVLKLESIFGEEAFRNQEGAEYLALKWIMSEDRLQGKFLIRSYCRTRLVLISFL